MAEARVIIALAVEAADDFIWSRLDALQTEMFMAGPVALKLLTTTTLRGALLGRLHERFRLRQPVLGLFPVGPDLQPVAIMGDSQTVLALI